MNSFLKRMFEDDDCSRQEADLKAAILGKTYDQCKYEWQRQFKKEFIVSNILVLRSFNCKPDAAGKINFIFDMHYYAELQKHLIMRCDNVQCGDIMLDMHNKFSQPRFDLTVSFLESEIDNEFIAEVEDAISAISPKSCA